MNKKIKCSNCENALNSTRYMHYVSTLLLILEDSECSAVQKQLKIQQIINGIENNRSELCRFTIAVEDVIRYGLRGEELKSYMSVGILEEEFEKKDAAWEQFALEMKDKYRG